MPGYIFGVLLHYCTQKYYKFLYIAPKLNIFVSMLRDLRMDFKGYGNFLKLSTLSAPEFSRIIVDALRGGNTVYENLKVRFKPGYEGWELLLEHQEKELQNLSK